METPTRGWPECGCGLLLLLLCSAEWVGSLVEMVSVSSATYSSIGEEVVIPSGRGCVGLPQGQTCSQFQISGLFFSTGGTFVPYNRGMCTFHYQWLGCSVNSIDSDLQKEK